MNPRGERVGAGMLLGAACGTAIASVSALGLFQIERLVGGVWSVAAVAVAAVLCRGVAGAFARLSTVVPSGAGLLAYLARGLGRRAGMALALPYLLLTLFLVGVEALIVGTMLGRLLGVPPLAGAAALVVGTWLVARAGVRFGYRTQAVATAVLVAGMLALSIAVVVRHAGAPDGVARLLPPVPDAARFAAAVGQALFLFMGFELVTTQVEVARAPDAVGRALRASVAVLAVFYAAVSLGFSALPAGAATACASGPGGLCPTGPIAGGTGPSQGPALIDLAPQLEIARAAGGAPAAVLCTALCVLAAFTSLNGALLALSRFIYALASQGVLPRGLAAMEGRRLVPRRALAALAAVALASTAVVAATGVAVPVILAAASTAALAYAAAVLVRERLPFAEAGRGLARRAAGGALAAALAGLGVAVLAGAGPARAAALIAVASAGVAASLLARRTRRKQIVRVEVKLAS